MKIKAKVTSGVCVSVLATALLSTSVGYAESLRKATGMTYWDKDRAYNGYTLFAAMGQRTTYLIDMEGNVVNSWPVGTNPRFLDNGNLSDRAPPESNDRLRGGAEIPEAATGATGALFLELDWDNNVAWSYRHTLEGYSPHHDWVMIFNPKLGEPTLLYIANKAISHEECIALGCDPANGPYVGTNIDSIVEADMDGNIIWIWNFVDHLVQDFDSTKANYVGTGKTIADYPHRLNINMPGHPVSRDTLHLNGMDYNQNLDQVMFDTVQGEVYIIDHGNTFVPGDLEASMVLAAGEKGDLLYRFGDPARYGQGEPPSTLVNWNESTTGHKQLGGIHNIQWIDDGLPGAGNLLMFNNGQYLGERMPQSYIYEVNPFLNANGIDTGHYVNPPDAGYYVWEPEVPRNTHKRPKNMSNQIVWIFSSKSGQNFFSHIGSGVQRLPNGNTLITAMTEGHLFEVTPEGELVWEYINPVTDQGEVVDVMTNALPMTNPTFRAYRYDASHPGLAGRDLTPSGPIGSQ